MTVTTLKDPRRYFEAVDASRTGRGLEPAGPACIWK